ncbi:hypothetical protein ACFPT7_13380 [Acidicapsa dinghuensis]|uniref:Uncharacterized protein n=1 Tax=Acidicapsa dinghuensis TaxID=2218256 RepID=A0ABW1EJ43_9BACT|nr:hypothetical protein [Acidicapsa dinghuensis]
MSIEFVTPKKPQEIRQLREELPGNWYNYESSETTLNRQHVSHWLANLEVSENSFDR